MRGRKMNPIKRKPILGWISFDFATQPFHTLLVTFIFAPYFTSAVAGSEAEGQAVWGFTIAAAGILIAVLAPVLGAMADTVGPKKPWIIVFSLFFVLGTYLLWLAEPGMPDYTIILFAFALSLIGVEFATTFTNAMLPEIAAPEEVGEVSGTGWAIGYLGGLVALLIVLLLVAENEQGKTLLGAAPILGLDPAEREGTRAVGPLTSMWYVVFMIPFFLWVPDVKRKSRSEGAVRAALKELGHTIKSLPQTPNLLNYLLGSMFYRDALIGGIYAFGGIFASGVLGWSIIQIGVFGILALVTGALGSWIGGRFDRARGPKFVIYTSIAVLLLVSVICFFTSRTSVFGIGIEPTSIAPDIIFYICGALIGAAGGALQAASRTMLVHLAEPERMTEAFGLYALAGKATSFLAPFSIGLSTTWTGDQHIGIFAPIIVLFLIGIVFLMRVSSEDNLGKTHAL